MNADCYCDCLKQILFARQINKRFRINPLSVSGRETKKTWISLFFCENITTFYELLNHNFNRYEF